MKRFLLFYDVADELVGRRARFRSAHLVRAAGGDEAKTPVRQAS
jgi:hypothetical protein